MLWIASLHNILLGKRKQLNNWTSLKKYATVYQNAQSLLHEASNKLQWTIMQSITDTATAADATTIKWLLDEKLQSPSGRTNWFPVSNSLPNASISEHERARPGDGDHRHRDARGAASPQHDGRGLSARCRVRNRMNCEGACDVLCLGLLTRFVCVCV